jgi:hypothetical protein
MIDIAVNKPVTVKEIIKRGIDIFAGKAVVAVELGEGAPDAPRDCRKCVFLRLDNCYEKFPCNSRERKDGKKVIFKLVDLPVGLSKICLKKTN